MVLVVMVMMTALYREVDGIGVDSVGGDADDSSVQGGREHNLPILVSRVTSNSPAAR